MGASCELTIRFGNFFEGVGCGTQGAVLLAAIAFGILGLATFYLRLKWLNIALQRAQRPSLPSSQAKEPKRCGMPPDNPFP